MRPYLLRAFSVHHGGTAVVSGRRKPLTQVKLGQGRVSILPTRLGLLFALVLFIMLLGSLNYNNSLAFVFTFTLAGLGMVGLWQTQRNLLGLHVSVGSPTPVFAGQAALFPLRLYNSGRRRRFAIGSQWRGEAVAVAGIDAFSEIELPLRVPTSRRGRLRPGRFRLFTNYPLGLFQAWSTLEFDMAVVVFPKPASQVPLPPSQPALDRAEGEVGCGHSDFDGLRGYVPGDTLRHVAWKTYARAEVLAVKEFSGTAAASLDLAFRALPGLATEERLAVLTRWVLDAHAAGAHYALRLPQQTIGPAAGDAHRLICLTTLASFGETA